MLTFRRLLIRIILVSLLASSLLACASNSMLWSHKRSIGVLSELMQGKQLFEEGYYKRTLRLLLPLACDGNCDAQYAIGYMYYYGYGVTQDTEVGYFWITRAASNHFPPAMRALEILAVQDAEECRLDQKYKCMDA